MEYVSAEKAKAMAGDNEVLRGRLEDSMDDSNGSDAVLIYRIGEDPGPHHTFLCS